MSLTLDIISEVYLQDNKNDPNYNPIWWNSPKQLKDDFYDYVLWDFPEGGCQYLCKKENREIIMKIYPNDGFAEYKFPLDIAIDLNKYYEKELRILGYKINIKELKVQVTKENQS
ncbi:MAG: hypothetical protein IJH34_16595 [Romboutsia sp.]|nr:hypothetical protein [Romboutsia sp.]